MDKKSWVTLNEICPLDLSNLIKNISTAETIVNSTIDLQNLDNYKQKLIKASGDIEMALSELGSLIVTLENVFETNLDRAIYEIMRDDLNRYISLVDDKQNKLLEINDGDPTFNPSIGKVSAFRKVLYVALYGIIYTSLDESSREYLNLTEEKRTPKNFLRLLFLKLSSKLSALGGVQRRTNSNARHRAPTTLASTYSRGAVDLIQKDYQERFGEQIVINEPQDILSEEDLFAREEEEQDAQTD